MLKRVQHDEKEFTFTIQAHFDKLCVTVEVRQISDIVNAVPTAKIRL